MPVFYDQLNRAVDIPKTPKRIISVVPSQTELLFDLGLRERLAGITKFCVHPADEVRNITKIGGTKQLNVDKIRELKPDLIIANKEENEQGQIEELMKLYPVWISDIYDLPGALDMIIKVGEITGVKAKAEELAESIAHGFEDLYPTGKSVKVAYLIWRKPYMAAGADTFINAMLTVCGLKNLIEASRYPGVTEKELIDTAPEILLLSSEPYPFTAKHISEFEKMLPNCRIELVDGEMFSWYGSRLQHAPAYFKSLIDKLMVK